METRKEQIAEAFARHFHHFGFRKTSVDDVARELGISKKTIYACFESKEEIFQYVIQQTAEQLLRGITPEVEGQPTYTARITRLLQIILDHARRFTQEHDPLDFRFDIAEKAFREAYQGFLHRLLEQGIQAGEFAHGPVGVRAALINGVISTGITLIAAGTPDVEQEVVEAVLNIAK